MNEHVSIENVRSSALAEGIKAVGVGKQGSVNCSLEQVDLILQAYRAGNFEDVQVGAFFGALWMKGVTEDEMELNAFFPENCIDKPERGIDYILKNTPSDIKLLAIKIIKNKILSYDEACIVGAYLFAQQNRDDAGKAFIASALRVRYTDPVEYSGLHKQIQKTFASQFKPVVLSKPLIQMAEPFDGVERSHLITPILARHFTENAYNVVLQTGRSSGPKFGLNLLEIAQKMHACFIDNSEALIESSSRVKGGNISAEEYYVEQKVLSSALDKWVEIRKLILKRPFLATLEKYVDPFGLNIFMASAFHHTFTDKMVEIAEEIGFPAIIISFRGVEGSLGLSLGRTAQLICSVRQKDGSYLRNTIEASPENYGFDKIPDPKLTKEDIAKNSELIQNYLQHKESGDKYFDNRVRYNIQVYEQALNWVASQLPFN